MDFLRKKSGNSRAKKNKECNKIYLEKKQLCETFIRNMNKLPSFDSSSLVKFLAGESRGNITRIMSEFFMIYENKPLEKNAKFNIPASCICTDNFKTAKKIRCTKLHSTGT